MSFEWLFHLHCSDILWYAYNLNQSSPSVYEAQSKTNHWTKGLRPGVDSCNILLSYTHPCLTERNSTDSVEKSSMGRRRKRIPVNMVVHLRCEILLTYEDAFLLIKTSSPDNLFQVTNAIAHNEDISQSLICLIRDFITKKSFIPMVNHKFFLRRHIPTILHFTDNRVDKTIMDVENSSVPNNTCTELTATAQQVDILSSIVKIFRSHGMNNNIFRSIAEKICIDAMTRRNTYLIDTNESVLRKSFYRVDLQMTGDHEYKFISLVASGNESALDEYLINWNTQGCQSSPYFSDTISHEFATICAVHENQTVEQHSYRSFRTKCVCLYRRKHTSTESSRMNTLCFDPRHQSQLKDESFFSNLLQSTILNSKDGDLLPYPQYVTSLYRFATRAVDFARDSTYFGDTIYARLWTYDIFTVVEGGIFRNSLPSYIYQGMTSNLSNGHATFENIQQKTDILLFGRYKHLQFMESLLFILGHWPAFIVLKSNPICAETDVLGSHVHQNDHNFAVFAAARLFLQAMPDPLQGPNDRFVFNQKPRTYSNLHHTMHWMEVFRLSLIFYDVVQQSYLRVRENTGHEFTKLQSCAAITCELANVVLSCQSEEQTDTAMFWWMLSLPSLMEACVSFLLPTRNFACSHRGLENEDLNQSKSRFFSCTNDQNSTVVNDIGSFFLDHIITLFKYFDSKYENENLSLNVKPKTIDIVARYKFDQSSGIDLATAMLSLISSQYISSIEMQSAHSMCVLYAKFTES